MISKMIFLKIAQEVSQASQAMRLKVGSIIVKEGNILAIGYNGTPSGFNNRCETAKGITKPEVLHAESNCISKCARSVNSSDKADLYTTHSPCFECCKLIIQAGIINVYYKVQYRDVSGLVLLKKAGIHVEQIDI